MRATVHVDGAKRVRPADIEDVDALLIDHLDELGAVRREELTGHSRGLAARVRLKLVLLTVDEQRLRPRLVRHLVARQRRVRDPERPSPEEWNLRIAAAEYHAARRVPWRRCGGRASGATTTTATTLTALSTALASLGDADLDAWRSRLLSGRLLGSLRLPGERFHEQRRDEQRAGNKQRETIAHSRTPTEEHA